MYQVLGWVNVGLLALLNLPYLLARVNRRLSKEGRKKLLPVIRFLRALHKPAGLLLLLASFYHGFLALGRFRLHTGSLLFGLAFVSALFGFAYYLRKKKVFLQIHRVFAGVIVLLLLLHLIWPWALR